jgi:hypothetical protein
MRFVILFGAILIAKSIKSDDYSDLIFLTFALLLMDIIEWGKRIFYDKN